MTLTDFLLARIAEDEAGVKSILGTLGLNTEVSSRRSRECEAKRRIVEEVMEPACELSAVNANQRILHHLTAAYADHPDYREEWKP